MKTIYPGIAIISLIFLSCRAPTVMLNPQLAEDKMRVAVLTFSNSGFLSGQKFGKFAADEVARQLFLQRKSVVIDRAIVNSTAAHVGIISANVLSQNQIRKLARNLNVQIIVTGEVRSLGLNLDPLKTTTGKLILNFRLIAPDSGIVLGVFTKEIQGAVEEEKLIKEMIKSLVKRMDELKIEESET